MDLSYPEFSAFLTSISRKGKKMKISQNSISTFSTLTINICVHNLKSVMSFLCIVSFSHNEENSLCIEESNAFLVLCFIQGKI